MCANRVLIVASTLLFLSGGVLGCYFGFQQDVQQQSDELDIESPEVEFLLKNNLKVMGAHLLFPYTIQLLIKNGFTLGFMVGAALNGGLSIVGVLAMVAPHGVLEFPGLLIAGTAGLKPLHELVRYLRGRKDHVFGRQETVQFIRLVIVASLLIVVAAFVEANVTASVAETFVSN